jgi:uncharacterized circularly permuted ATP-grasp superfamily protein
MTEYYDEVFEKQGTLRPHYADVYGHWKTLSKSYRSALHKNSIQHYSGDYAQDPLPRILTNAEVCLLRSGVEQRARAILAFLSDYSKNGNRWRKVMPAYMIKSIIARHHTTNFLKGINPETIAFPYGPDIIRDRYGDWRVVEDSGGYIGGMGDLLQNRKTLFKLVPEYRSSLPPIYSPNQFFKELAEYYKIKAAKNDGIALFYLSDFDDEPDKETRRLAENFSRLGIEVTNYSNRRKKIVTENNETFLVSKGRKQKIGALILRTPPEHLEMQYLRLLIKQYRDGNYKNMKFIEEFSYNSFKNNIKNGTLWTNFSPGVQFVNDKIFGLYIDSMIKKLMHEKPILKTITAQPFALRQSDGTWKIDQKLLSTVRQNINQFVIKEVDKDGGVGVWIGPKESKQTLEELVRKVRSCPERYIVQEFQHLSVIENRIVDLRIHAHVDHEKIIISNTPWGRANWLNGDGKVNISTNGFTSPVVVLKH